MAQVIVGNAAEIKSGEKKIVVPFRGKAGIAVFNVGGKFYALRNICPHKLGPLCTGRITGRAVAEHPPSVLNNGLAYESEGQILRCPWHQWEFEIATGRCLVDSEIHAKTYQVIVKKGKIIVEYDD